MKKDKFQVGDLVVLTGSTPQHMGLGFGLIVSVNNSQNKSRLRSASGIAWSYAVYWFLTGNVGAHSVYSISRLDNTRDTK